MVTGVLFRPAATFQWAQQNVRFGYWWILISVFTLEAVGAIYRPELPGMYSASDQEMALQAILFLLMLYDLQALILLGVSRVFRWQITWADSLKYVGLAWAPLFVNNLVTFYPSLKGMNNTVLWVIVPFFLWYLLALTAGVRRLSGFPTWKAFFLVAVASVPWQAGFFWNNWTIVHRVLL